MPPRAVDYTSDCLVPTSDVLLRVFFGAPVEAIDEKGNFPRFKRNTDFQSPKNTAPTPMTVSFLRHSLSSAGILSPERGLPQLDYKKLSFCAEPEMQNFGSALLLMELLPFQSWY